MRRLGPTSPRPIPDRTGATNSADSAPRPLNPVFNNRAQQLTCWHVVRYGNRWDGAFAEQEMEHMVEFGWLEEDYTFRGRQFCVFPSNNYYAAIQAVKREDREVDGWFYPPLVRDGKNLNTLGVSIHARAFKLPATHTLQITATSSDPWLANFTIQMFGFLKGLRLLPAEWFHFYRAAIKPGKLVDFVCSPTEIEEVTARACDFWRAIPDQSAERALLGLFHWYLFGQSYEHEFERFGAQYTVLDGCFSFLKRWGKAPDQSHARRPEWLCKRFSIPVPDWAAVQGDKSAIAVLRNEFVHDAQYAGHPIGFAFPDGVLQNIEPELTNLNARLLLAILGVEADYIHSTVNTRQISGLDLKT